MCVAVLTFGALALALPAAQTPAVDPATGVIHSKRMASGVPLGGMGCGTFELMSDGAISRATINNNLAHPTGDLKGCFAAAWTSANGKTAARALRLSDPYGLPAVAGLDFLGLTPQAFVSYPDRALAVKLSLRAYSSLIPNDLRLSSIPAALFVFTVVNDSRAPVEASIALSWEDILGVGGSAANGPFADRTGDRVEPLPPSEGVIGLRMSSPRIPSDQPAERMRNNAAGNYALLVQPTSADVTVTSGGWNALDSRPGWWEGFSREGTIAGAAPPGKEGSAHPAGVVAVKVALREREVREIPFVVAWYTPRQWTLSGAEYGHLYERSWDDAAAAGRFALENRRSLAALTDGWQRTLLTSSLPPWMQRRLIDDVSVLLTNSRVTRDSGLPPPDAGPPLLGVADETARGGGFQPLDQMLPGHPLLASWFPADYVRSLRAFRDLQLPGGELPSNLGDADHALVPRTEVGSAALPRTSPDAACVLAYLVWKQYAWSGDQKLLDDLYPAAKHALQWAARLDKGEGVPAGPSALDALAQGRTTCYRLNLWLGTLRVASRMADAMNDRGFAAELRGWESKAREASERFWNGRYLRFIASPPSEQSYAGQLAGVWMTDSLGAGDPLAPDREAAASASLRMLNDRGADAPALLDPPPLGGPPVAWPGWSTLFQAALYTERGNADAGLEIMQRIDRALVERAHSPWAAPLELRADTGTSAGPVERSPAMSASWLYLAALEGFALDVAAGKLTIAPRLPAGWKELTAPIYAPIFAGTLEYHAATRRPSISLRLDRFVPAATAPARLQVGAGLTLRQVTLPFPPGTSVIAAIDRAPAPGHEAKDEAGRFVYVFEAPVKLTAGQRLQFTARTTP